MGTAPRRNYWIASTLAQNASHSTVLTAMYPDRQPLPIPGADIIPVRALDYRTVLRRRTKDGYLAETTKKQAWKQWFIRLINSFPINIIVGEGGLIYFFTLLRRGQQAIKQHQITHLYSSYRPFADHYAAYWLKKRNPHLFWIADFRDVIVDPHYGHLLFPETHQQWFKKIFSLADTITTVSDGLASSLRPYNTNVLTIRNGIKGPIAVLEPKVVEKFSILYTGSMMLNTRNPEPLFVAVRILMDQQRIFPADVLIQYAGKDGNQWTGLASQYHLMQSFNDYGIVPSEKAQQMQSDACINLLLTTSSSELQGVLTGKMIEYFEAGSPVLAIISNSMDAELQHIMEELNIGNCYTDKEESIPAIMDFIFREYTAWKKTGTNRKPVKLDILNQKYSMQATIQPLLEIL